MKNGDYILKVAPPEYPGKKYRGRYAYEHHLVYWGITAIVVAPGEVIHHKNHNKTDNRFSNLELLKGGVHTSNHNSSRRVNLIFFCPVCGKEKTTTENKFKFRTKNSSYNKLFCGRSCGSKHQNLVRRGGHDT